ncbi:hypothetical protein Tco_0234249, partial [Tanacetum coccineum]
HFKSKCPIVKIQKYENKKISTLSERQAENKRKLNNTSKNNQNQQQPNKRQNTGKAYAAGHGEKKYYGGFMAGPSRCVLNATIIMMVHVLPNATGGTGAHGVVHTLRGEETDQDPNNIKDEIKA